MERSINKGRKCCNMYIQKCSNIKLLLNLAGAPQGNVLLVDRVASCTVMWGGGEGWGCHQRNVLLVDRLASASVICDYHYYSCEFDSYLWQDLLNTTLYDKVCQWLTAVVCGLLLVLQFSLQIKQSSRNCQSCQIWPAKFGQILIRTDTKLVFCNRKLMRTDIFLARTTKPICNFANPDKKTCDRSGVFSGFPHQ
jgi:hypothetical protein